MVKTIVRVKEGISIPNQFEANLKKLFQQDISIEICKTAPDLQRSYQNRIDIFHQAVLFLLKAVPTAVNEEEIKSYLNWCRDVCPVPQGLTVKAYQEILCEYTALIAGGIKDFWNTAEPVQWLNKAEQYVIMQNGRDDLATISEYTPGVPGKYILQWDRQQPPCTEETLAELDMIKNSGLAIAPEWFKELPTHEKMYFHTTPPHLKTKAQLKTDIHTLDATWKELRCQTEYAVLVDELNRLAANPDSAPGWIMKFSASHQLLLKNLTPAGPPEENWLQMIKSINRLKQEDLLSLEKLRSLPLWFLLLPDFEQRLLSTSLAGVRQAKDGLSFLSSRMRTIPALANFAAHSLLILDAEGEVLNDFGSRLRSSHPASRDVIKMGVGIADLHARRNFSKIQAAAASKPLLIQTLISPVPIMAGYMPDYALEQQRLKEVSTLQAGNSRTYSTNHPLNMAKYLNPTGSGSSECLQLYNGVKEQLTQELNQQESAESQSEASKLFADLNRSCLGFVQNNFMYKGIELLKLIENFPLDWEGVEPADIKKQIRAALKIAEKRIHGGSGSQSRESSPSVEVQRQTVLVDFFIAHNPRFYTWLGYTPVMANCFSWLSRGKEAREQFASIRRNCNLMQLAMQYHELLNSNYGTGTLFDYNGRELNLSSLEHLLMVHLDGLSYGSCVSGKDRKALELLHTDAMLIYHDKYGIWPLYSDTGEERANFALIVAYLYLTRHAHEHAMQNAPGSDGIKHAFKYLPKDMVDQICRLSDETDYLKRDDILATNNEPDRIGELKIKPGFAGCVLAVLRLNPAGQAEYLKLLKTIVDDRQIWTQQKSGGFLNLNLFSPAVPQGIEDIRKVFERNEKSTLASIFFETFQRPESSYWRNPLTQSLYDSIRRLYTAANPVEALKKELEVLEELRAKMGGAATMEPAI